MEAALSWRKFKEAVISPDLEDPPAVRAVICNSKLLAKLVKGQNVSDATSIEVDRCAAKIGLFC